VMPVTLAGSIAHASFVYTTQTEDAADTIIAVAPSRSTLMACKSCQSENQRSFPAELAIHHPGREGLTKPLVWLFPSLVICFNCGFAEFTVPEPQLEQFGNSAA